ncbi:site-specific DNA-methyltransferase [Dethiosulfatarculus sandiegensis]|uniref:site-specific DNA-methyltransferase (adenine-specific) n=1 Tax=Dethiosulfatarculus sandiegensis TaxID=1429043 RepID=A0A0D2IZ78_9BACT|nr:site-specific DNA-methyltransferase [Dethiosulfatarculus sandiegensis]KIX11334.1 DNA methylase [Dethiosulfatarculus sandiegensis]
MATRKNKAKDIETIIHTEDSRANIPTAEYQSVMASDEKSPIQVAYERRNRDLDPQLVWRGKDEQDWSDLVVQAPPLYIQEKVHPKVLIDDLKQLSQNQEQDDKPQFNLFADFNGINDEAAKTEFYQHEANWTNRIILGDSLQVMASLAEREGLRGKVQCIYMDPPYGIKFNSNFQWSTTSRDVKDGKAEHITREPEQVKAFRDTWRDGIHSYLTYLRDRLTVARDLLTESGSIFVQIGDENVHRVRALMDEIFGEDNCISLISFRKTGSTSSALLDANNDFILWYAHKKQLTKFRPLFFLKKIAGTGASEYKSLILKNLQERPLTKQEINNTSNIPTTGKVFTLTSVVSDGTASTPQTIKLFSKTYQPGKNEHWKTTIAGMKRLYQANRLSPVTAKRMYRRFFDDYPIYSLNNNWQDVRGALGKTYVVQTTEIIAQRCILMTTDPGDLVLDPTCGSGTTAYVAEQWGRRWITMDTSRVALALARARVMGARYPYYTLADSKEGQIKEAELSRKEPSLARTYGNIRQGFVYERVPHITLKSIANNAEIDVIWEEYQEALEPLRQELNQALGASFEEWEIPREPGDPWPEKATRQFESLQNADTEKKKLSALKKLNSLLGRKYTLETLPNTPYDLWTDEKAIKFHASWWENRIARQEEIDASIAAKADHEYLYDKPYVENSKVRVAGPFTVESLSPHRVLGVDENDDPFDPQTPSPDQPASQEAFVDMILENLRTSGVQQAHKEDKIDFRTLVPWPGYYICAEGRYYEGNQETGAEKRAAIFIGPEFGSVSREDLVAAARETGDAGFDVLISCAFNYDAQSAELNKLGRVLILKARMNADLHMADDLKNTGKGNLFVIFGEPDIDLLDTDEGQIQVRINGVDVFHPNTGEVRSDGPEGIACWFIDTDYNEESFFVRHAYFLGANDPYKALKTTLKAEINPEAWDSLHSDTSRPFDKPKSGRIAVKVINHLGDEAMKVFRVE